MSAVMRYQKLQRKVIALETAGQAGCDEHRRAKSAMQEVLPLMSDVEKTGLGLLEPEGGKIAESVGVDVNMPIVEAKKPRARKPKEAKDEAITDAASVNEAANDPASASN